MFYFHVIEPIFLIYEPNAEINKNIGWNLPISNQCQALRNLLSISPDALLSFQARSWATMTKTLQRVAYIISPVGWGQIEAARPAPEKSHGISLRAHFKLSLDHPASIPQMYGRH